MNNIVAGSSKKVTYHDDLEQLILERTKVTEIIILFDINEVDYCTLTKVFFELDRYVNEIQDILSFNHQILTQDDVNPPSKNKLKLRQLEIK